MDRLGLYLRISDDRDGNQTATERQRDDCQRFASSKGWHIADVFEDVDLSAFKRSVKRPEFERMLDAVRSKAIDGVLAWKIDRITRRQRDLVRLDEACEDAGGFIATVVDQIDTRHPTSRFVAEMLTAQARMESENASVRIKRKHEERVSNGYPNSGGHRPFGYARDRKHIVPEEAALIREAVARLFAGESLRGIAVDWNTRGILTTAGHSWMRMSLRRMLMGAVLSGQREHHGKLSPGNWPAILTPDETEQIRAILSNPSRRSSLSTPRRYLLSGLLYCGRCSEPLVARPTAKGIRRYACARRDGIAACGRLARVAEPVEETVAEMVFLALDGADISAFMPSTDDSQPHYAAAIRADEEALEELSRDYYTERRISRAEFFTARDVLAQRIASNRSLLARTSTTSIVSGFIGAGEELRKRWPDTPFEWKRAVIEAVVERVELEPTPRRGVRTFDPSLVRIVWRF